MTIASALNTVYIDFVGTPNSASRRDVALIDCPLRLEASSPGDSSRALRGARYRLSVFDDVDSADAMCGAGATVESTMGVGFPSFESAAGETPASESSAAAWLIARYTDALSFHGGGPAVGSAHTVVLIPAAHSASAMERTVKFIVRSTGGMLRRLKVQEEGMEEIAPPSRPCREGLAYTRLGEFLPEHFASGREDG
jgi:hypothetical protein